MPRGVDDLGGLVAGTTSQWKFFKSDVPSRKEQSSVLAVHGHVARTLSERGLWQHIDNAFLSFFDEMLRIERIVTNDLE